MEAGKERLTRDTVRDATLQEIEHLKRENHDLKQLVADLSLEIHRFKKRPSQLSVEPQVSRSIYRRWRARVTCKESNIPLATVPGYPGIA